MSINEYKLLEQAVKALEKIAKLLENGIGTKK